MVGAASSVGLTTQPASAVAASADRAESGDATGADEGNAGGAKGSPYCDPATRATAGGPARAREAAPALMGDPLQGKRPQGVASPDSPGPPREEEAPPPRRRAQKAPAGVAGAPPADAGTAVPCLRGGEAWPAAASAAAHTLTPVPALAKEGLAGGSEAARSGAGAGAASQVGGAAQMS